VIRVARELVTTGLPDAAIAAAVQRIEDGDPVRPAHRRLAVDRE
jgi:hypothetical protein